MRTHLLLFSLAGLLGCGGPALEDGLDPGAAEYEDAATAPVLTFRSNYTITQQGRLVKGRRVQIRYDAARLPGCRGGLPNGQPAWTITGYAMTNGGPAQSFWVAGFSPTGNPAPPSLVPPAAGDLAIWFQVTNRWGCIGYDSDFGRNYHFRVYATP
jgi:hypothetical protein